jgi:hypothetical protein
MKVKYPRTYHVSWSPGKTSDDKTQFDLSKFEGKYIVLTEKMDGENTTISRDYTHARSLDSADHISRHWLKGMWGNMRYNIPEGWRICGENLYAKHSLGYDNLSSYFMVFSIWNEKNECLSITETIEWCQLLELQFVPILYQGMFDLEFIKNFKVDTKKQEGFVMRIIDGFNYEDFNSFVVKWVRESHVSTSSHWMNEKIIKNLLK